MRKFKVGDKVILTAPNLTLISFKGEMGEVIHVEPDGYEGLMVYQIFIKDNINGDRYFWVQEDWISLDSKNIKNQIPKMTDDEIYNMLKPKMEKMGIDYNGTMTALTMDYFRTESINHYMPIEDVKRLVATVYRSGYGRGQKGLSFVIGKKKQSGHWIPCKHGENLTPGTKVRRNAVQTKESSYSIARIPTGTEAEVLDGNKDSYVSILCDSIWIGPVNGENGKNKKAYNQFANISGFSAVYIDSATEYFDKWVEE